MSRPTCTDETVMTDMPLNSRQTHALLDILSHHQTYSEIRDFRRPGLLEKYGPPFTSDATASETPSLQALVSRFVLNAPCIRDIDDTFWTERVSAVITGFQEAELSESYDKGTVGIRKTLSTAVSALIEYPIRGVFGGFDEPEDDTAERKYDTSKAEDLQRAFRDTMHQVVYGSLIDEAIAKIEETDKLSDHTLQVQAAHEYILVNFASFLHFTLIVSPKGQSLLTLMDHANKLVPYSIIKQTLRIGNVATMINAMVRVALAKMSMGSVTNWVGWTSGADEGMNLMQHIISQVLQWDIRDLKSRASKAEKHKKGPEKQQLAALKDYSQKTRDEHVEIRKDSLLNQKSIVMAILEADSTVSTTLDASQHKLALDYLATILAIRDREQIIKVLCHSQPDQLTQLTRDIVAAYEPLIRGVHNAVDLSDSITDLEYFLKDLIKVSKISDKTFKGPKPQSVGDFVQLLKKHQSSFHKFLHQVCKNGKDITSWYRDYILEAASNFRRTATASPNPPSKSNPDHHAGDLTGALNDLFKTLPEEQHPQHIQTLEEHAAYLESLHKSSARRLDSVLHCPPSKHPALKVQSLPASRSASPAPSAVSSMFETDHGPGAYLARWQALIDATEITPLKPNGPIRTGANGSVLKASRAGAEVVADEDQVGDGQKQDSNGDSDEEDVFEEAREQMEQSNLNEKERNKPPDTRVIVETLTPGFKDLLAKRGRNW